jgi:hypothetical protein
MILPGLFRELLAIVHTGGHFGNFGTADTGSSQAHDVARKLLTALAAPQGVFSALPAASVLVRLKLMRVAADLATAPAAGSAPAQQLLQEHFLDCLTHPRPQPEGTGVGNSLAALSHPCLQAADSSEAADVQPPERLRNNLVALFVAHRQLGASVVATAVDRVLRREETDWSFIGVLIPKIIRADPSIAPVLLENLRAVFAEATAELGAAGAEQQGTGLGRILSAITLLRFVLFGGRQKSDMQALYKHYLDCFRESFVTSAAVGSVKKAVLALVRALTVQAPCEGAQYLKLHIAALNPRHNTTPAGCKEAIKAYISLAKTRLTDLGETSASLGKRIDDPGQGGSNDDIRKEILGYVTEFKRTGAASRTIFSRFMFRKNWWQLSAEPVLLAPISDDIETRSAQRQLIEALSQDRKTKVMREGALEIFDLACVAGDEDDDVSGNDGPSARLGKLLSQHEECWKNWSADRASSVDSSGARCSEISRLCDKIKQSVAQVIHAAEESAVGTDADNQLVAVAARVLDSFCVSRGHAVTGRSMSSAGDDETRPMYEQLAVYCTAIRGLAGPIHSKLVQIVTVVGATEIEQSTCDGIALYLALESCCVLGGADTEELDDAMDLTGDDAEVSATALDGLFSSISWWKSRAWLHWFLRFGAAYTRAVLATCDALHTTPSEHAAVRARIAGECAAYLPRLALLQPSMWLVDRTRAWLAAAPPSRVLARAPQGASAAIVSGSDGSHNAGEAATDSAAYRWLVGDWMELMSVLTTLGIHLTLDTLPMESWVGYETKLRTSAEYLPPSEKLAYLRTCVFEVYLAQHGAAAICAAVLRGLLASGSDHRAEAGATAPAGAAAAEEAAASAPSAPTREAPPETVHCFLLLVQELASLSLHLPSARLAPSPFSAVAATAADEFAEAGAGWLLQFVATEFQQLDRAVGAEKSNGRLEQLMGYCLLLPPALLWGGGATAAEPTRGLDAVWTFIDRSLLQQRPGRAGSSSGSGGFWNAAMATHVCRGLLHHCHAGAAIESVKHWLRDRPRLMAALLTPHWRLVCSAAEALLGTASKEALLGSWETALYAAEGAVAPDPPHPEETLGVFFSVVSEDPVAAAVALHAVCLRAPPPTQEDGLESAAEVGGGRMLAADMTVGIVKQLFTDATAEPSFQAKTTPQQQQSSGGGGGGGGRGSGEGFGEAAGSASSLYELRGFMAPVQRAAVTFVQLLAARCATRQPSVRPDQGRSALEYSTVDPGLSLEAWLTALCWRLLASLVDAAPWLLLAVGREPSLRDPSASSDVLSSVSSSSSSAGPGPTPASEGLDAVFLTLLEWLPSESLGSSGMMTGQIALTLCGHRLNALLNARKSMSAASAAAAAGDGEAAAAGGAGGGGCGGGGGDRRLVASIERLVSAIGAASIAQLPPSAAEQLAAAVPHLAAVLRPRPM